MSEMFVKRTAVLLDTDIGSNVDDAIALAYLLRQPHCELLGVTTVSGEPHLRASIAAAVCAEADRPDVPVHVGAELPLAGTQRQPVAAHYEALTNARRYSNENTAVSFLNETIRSRPGEITLLTIGPFTNIALLFETDPEIPALLHGVVSMAGEYFNANAAARPEWNIYCDPIAAATVLRASLRHRLIGLDVTRQCVIDRSRCLEQFALSGPPFKLVAKMAELWFNGKQAIAFHDPLAAAAVFVPMLCRMLPVDLSIILEAEYSGKIVAAERETARLSAARTVDADAFFSHFFDIVD